MTEVLPVDYLPLTGSHAVERAPARSFALINVSLEHAGKRLLDKLNLTLEPNARHVLMGPNGAGKSLTLRLLQGLIAPTSGYISQPTLDAARAIVLQRPVLLRRSAAANLCQALAAYGVPRAQRRREAARWLALAGLEDSADTPARRLSGGEQQRLSCVRAMAAKPTLLLLDEPTAHLDPAATAAIEMLIGKAQQKGATILMVTHDAGQARRIADRVIFMDRGRICEQTAATAFFADAQSLEARAYLEGRLW